MSTISNISSRISIIDINIDNDIISDTSASTNVNGLRSNIHSNMSMNAILIGMTIRTILISKNNINGNTETCTKLQNNIHS